MDHDDIDELTLNLALGGVRAWQAAAWTLSYHLEQHEPDAPWEVLGSALLEVLTQTAQQPERLQAAWEELCLRMARLSAEPTAVPAAGRRVDRRFRDREWTDNPFLELTRRAWSSGADWLHHVVDSAEGMDEATLRKAHFFVRQLADAVAPSNFPFLNPEVLRTTLDARGRNLVVGMDRLLADLEQHQGRLAPKLSGGTFTLGVDLAATPGHVIHEGPLCQLIQYTPTTSSVYQRPLVIVPPWINKYYILDLRPENSLVRWAVERGYTVFLISWVNPDAALADTDFENYLLQGVLPALETVREATGEASVSALGYCIGGTLLATALAWLAARGEASRIGCATLLATLVDFSEPGDLGAFIDERQLQGIEARMKRRGYLDAVEMMTTFSLLRASELFWPAMVDNYLLGREPPPLDLLYWNGDATRLPARAHATYLRSFYQRNLLVEPGGLSFGGAPLDLRAVRVPLYVQASREDHIALWRSVYRGLKAFSGPVRFVLAGSGHVAGTVSPPSAGKYGYQTSEALDLPPTPEAWLEGAAQQRGSWWTDWDAWLSARSGPQVPARTPGERGPGTIEPAPGRYVRVRAVPCVAEARSPSAASGAGGG